MHRTNMNTMKEGEYKESEQREGANAKSLDGIQMESKSARMRSMECWKETERERRKEPTKMEMDGQNE